MSFADDPAIEALLEPIDLEAEGRLPSGSAPPPGRRAPHRSGPHPLYRAAVLGVALLFLFAVVGLAVVSDSSSGRSTLARIREHVRSSRSAAFTGTTSTRTESTPPDEHEDYAESSTVEGEVRLPDEGRVIAVDTEGYASETLLHVDKMYERSAETRAELGQEPWSATTAPGAVPDEFMSWILESMGDQKAGHAAEVMRDPGVIESFQLAMAMDTGMPVHLDALLGRLQGLRKTGSSQLSTTMSLRAFFGEEFVNLLNLFSVEAEASFGGSDDGSEEPDQPPPATDQVDGPRLVTGTIDVRLDHGPGGRLDALYLRLEVDTGDEVTHEEHQFRFTDWGKPFSLTLPQASEIDRSSDEQSAVIPGALVDEKALAEAQASLQVWAPAAASLPAGWALQAAQAVKPGDDASDECPSVSLQFGPSFGPSFGSAGSESSHEVRPHEGAGDNPDDGSDHGPEDSADDGADDGSDDAGMRAVDLPDMLSIRSTPATCAGDRHATSPGSEPIAVGRWRGRITRPAGPDERAMLPLSEVVLDVDGTRVEVFSTLPEAQLVRMLATLKLFQLADYPRGEGPPFITPGGVND